MSYMAIQPTVRTPVLERTSGEKERRVQASRGSRGYADHSHSTWDPVTVALTHMDYTKKISTISLGEVDGRNGTVKHLLSPVEDCLETRWLAETHEIAGRAAKAKRRADRMAK